MIEISLWTHPQTGAERLYVNGHPFDRFFAVWLEKCPDTGAALIHWRLEREIDPEAAVQLTRRGFDHPYNAAIDACSTLDLSSWDRLRPGYESPEDRAFHDAQIERLHDLLNDEEKKR